MTTSEHTREEHRQMILHPLRWPLMTLPLKRFNPFEGDGNCAVFAPPLNVIEIPADEPITIRIGTIFHKLSELPTKTYTDVDALLDDGWMVD